MRLTKRTRDGIWLLSYYDDSGKRRRVSTGCRERADAEREAQRILAGVGPRAQPKTLGDALDAAWRTRWEGQKGADRTKYVVQSLHKRLGSTPCSDATYVWLEGLAEEWKDEGLAASTINQRLTLLHVAMDLAAKRGWMVAVPPVPRQRVRNAKLRFLSWDEEDLLLRIASGREDHIMVDLIPVLLDTGARLSEITTLADENIRGEEIVLEDTKNGKTRVVPLTRRAGLCLRRLRRRDDWRSVTRGVRASAVRKSSAKDFLVKRFTRLRDEAGMTDVSLHTLRHTCASRLVQAGADLYRVKEWLGHSSITVTERYAHLAESSLRSEVSLLERPAADVVNIREAR